MAKQAGLSDGLFVDGVDLTSDIGSVERIGAPTAVLDVTAINEAAHERIYALGDGEISFNHYFNDAAGQEYATLKAKASGADRIATWIHGSAIGNAAAALVAKETSYDFNRGADGSLAGPSQFLGNAKSLDYCEQLTAGKRTDTGATNGASHNFGAATATGLAAYLHVFSVTGTSVTVAIQSSSDDGAGDAYSTILTFATVNAGATGKERKTLASLTTAVEQYLRVITTGTFNPATFCVVATRFPYVN